MPFNYTCQHCNNLYTRAQRLPSSKFCSYRCRNLVQSRINRLGKKHSEETKQKLSEATKAQLNRNPHPMLGKKHTEEARLLIKAGRNNGKWKLTESGSHKISETHKGSNNVNWKGDKVGYDALHHWVNRALGRPQKCEHCGINEDRRYHWANKTGKYLRDTSDWLRLCPKCHKKYDKKYSITVPPTLYLARRT